MCKGWGDMVIQNRKCCKIANSLDPDQTRHFDIRVTIRRDSGVLLKEMFEKDGF